MFLSYCNVSTQKDTALRVARALLESGYEKLMDEQGNVERVKEADEIVII